MTLEPLRVDAEMLGEAGQRLLSAAQALPDPPEAFSIPAGTDALSQALALEIPKAETPIIEGLPPMKQAAIGTAESVVEAARRYLSTDTHLKSKYDEQMNPSGGGGSTPGGGGGGAATPAVGGAAAAPAAFGAPGGGGMGAMGGMMGMPMQMAQQAAQIPQQIGGMVSSLPQSAMQGAQQVGEQVTQLVEQFSDKDSQEDEPGGRHRAEEPDGAAAGKDDAERAPAAARGVERPDPTVNL